MTLTAGAKAKGAKAMFDVIADTIYFNGEAVAMLRANATPTVLSRAIEAIELIDEWDSLWADHQQEIDEAYKEGYHEARDRYEVEMEALQEKLDSIREAIGAAPIS